MKGRPRTEPAEDLTSPCVCRRPRRGAWGQPPARTRSVLDDSTSGKALCAKPLNEKKKNRHSFYDKNYNALPSARGKKIMDRWRNGTNSCHKEHVNFKSGFIIDFYKKGICGDLANIVSDLQIDLGKINILLLDPPVQEQSVPLLL